MDISDAYCHTCSCVVEAPAQVAFDYMSDGIRQGEWTFGSWDRRQVDEHLFSGRSMFDDKETFIRIDADLESGVIRYAIGDDPKNLLSRNMARIVAGRDLGWPGERCLVTLMAWRAEFMSDDRWKQLCVSHETQMFIIKARIESNPD
ncbi:hypothetical protein [Elongatibacter sediminis]|uniref:Uncharacterized protein n=1 Tax=Elongatibacter sediminis TaxID=3119006 RepID=A0AAW9R4N7_9GAMM